MRRSCAILILFLLLLPGTGVFSPLGAQLPEPPAEEEIQEARSAPLFLSHELLQITLEADFSSMRQDDRDPDAEERPAVMEWTEESGYQGALDIQIGTRGNFRLSRRNCDFPPLRINVRKKSTKGTIFDGQDKLKLVVPCKLRQGYWQQYVLQEYLVYRAFNLLTERSFRVRLAEVTFVDVGGDDDPFTRLVFIIEDDDVMALRNGGRKVDWTTGQLDPRHLEERHAVLVEVFQYMIGNTDWSGVEMHNMELIEGPDRTLSTVPFDFDFSGIVDARYAVPDASLPIRSVRDRLFRGFCPEQTNRDPGIYEEVFALFLEHREEILDLWRNMDAMDDGRKRNTLGYLEDFFDTLENRNRMGAVMARDCRRIGS